MAKIGHKTLTEGQSNKLTDQFSKELFFLKKKLEILKTRITQFHWRVEWEVSTRECLTGILSLYEEILIDMNHMIMKDMEEEQDWEETDLEEISELFKKVRQLKSENMDHKPAEEEMRASNKEGEKGLKCSKCMFQVAIKNKNQKKKALVKLRKHECKEEKKMDDKIDKTEESGDIEVISSSETAKVISSSEPKQIDAEQSSYTNFIGNDQHLLAHCKFNTEEYGDEIVEQHTITMAEEPGQIFGGYNSG